MKQKITQSFIAKIEPKDKSYDIYDIESKYLFLRILPSGAKSWYIKPNNQKTIRIGNANLISPAQARDKTHQILCDIANNGNYTPKTKKCNTLKELLDVYLEAGGSKYISITLRARYDLTTPLSKFSPLFFERWRKDFNETHKIATSNRTLVALKALFNWGEKRGLCVNTLRTIKKLKESDSKVIMRYLSEDERARLMKELDNQPLVFRAFVITANKTGIRRNALLNLLWSDLNFSDKTILLRGTTAKSRQTHILPMAESVAEILQQLPRISEYVFANPVTGNRYKDLRRRFDNVVKASGIKDFRFHDLRHDFASQLVMRGVDLNTVRELMTHSDITMTMRYAHLAPNSKKRAVDLL